MSWANDSDGGWSGVTAEVVRWQHASVECVPADTFFREHIQWLGQEVINFVHHQLRPKPTKHTKQTLVCLALRSQSPPRLLLPDDEDHLQTTSWHEMDPTFLLNIVWQQR